MEYINDKIKNYQLLPFLISLILFILLTDDNHKVIVWKKNKKYGH
jgi:hypothetical protein